MFAQVEQATLFLFKNKKQLHWYFRRATPTSSQVTFQLIVQLEREREREDANTSYLTGGRQKQPPLPFPPRGGTAGSVVVTFSHKAMLSSSTTPSDVAPTAAVHTKTQRAWLIILVAVGKFWQTRSGKIKSCKATVRDGAAP